MLAKIVKFCKENEKDLILAGIIILVALISFGLGRLSKIREGGESMTIENIGANVTSSVPPGSQTQNQIIQQVDKKIVASKNGTKYHYPWCPGAQQIKEENKIWFSSIEEARKVGYTPAANCKGLK